MKKIVTLLSLLLCSASLCWGQYNTTYKRGASDITSYLNTTNAWKALPNPGVCQQNTLTIGVDGYTVCRGTDNYLYGRNVGDLNWVRLTSMGTAAQFPTVHTAADIWSLQTSSRCGSGLGLFHWSGTAWTQPGYLCALQFSVGNDGTTLMAIGTDHNPRGNRRMAVWVGTKCSQSV
jgi:hypothetical protein